MMTGGYYCGERCQISPANHFDSNHANADGVTRAPEESDGILKRYGNVVIATGSNKKFSFESNEAAVRAMLHAAKYNDMKGY